MDSFIITVFATIQYTISLQMNLYLECYGDVPIILSGGSDAVHRKMLLVTNLS